jgi:pimeloyl-ACP methyl ester carboxylesterase
MMSRHLGPSPKALRPNVTCFTPSLRAGNGPPLVCLHGFLDTWHVWDLVRPTLERHHEVLALTLAGHAGGPPLQEPSGSQELADAVERAMDTAGVETAHLVGNSLGGHVALQLAARGRAATVVALAPAGGWAVDDTSAGELLAFQRQMRESLKTRDSSALPLPISRESRRLATRLLTTNFEHIPAQLLADQASAAASCPAADRLIDHALRHGWSLNAERISCPVRILWGTADRLLPWPRAAARYLHEWLPHADWVMLDDVGHCPQLDIPLETAHLILGFTSP